MNSNNEMAAVAPEGGTFSIYSFWEGILETVES